MIVATPTTATDPLLTLPRTTTTAPPAYHHPSHTELLNQVAALGGRVEVDAVIVPTARPVAYLYEAARLAHQLGCPLVVLCSKWSRAPEAVRWARLANLTVKLIAVDTNAMQGMPEFATSKMLAGTRLGRKTDTSAKRNIGLALARMAGWERIVFLDDDIAVERPDDLRSAAALLDSYKAVGLANSGFPDNSVVCYAYRLVGEFQDTFIGGGALAVSPTRDVSFFPNIYNEDWFFLLDDAKLSPVARTGNAKQKPFDPFADPGRARSEEFGDCLAEGVYSLLDEGKRVQDATVRFWRSFLSERKRLITDVLGKIPAMDAPKGEKERMIAALRAAHGRHAYITSALCFEYLQAWRADRESWRTYLDDLPRGLTVQDALAKLGLGPRFLRS
jgi:hypothetical protein